MKKIILLLFVIGLPMIISAQYQSIFGVTSTSWNIAVENLALNKFTTDSVTTGADTTINGTIYHKILFYFIDHLQGPPVLVNTGYVHEDLTAGKGWIIVRNPGGTNSEFLFYDLSLAVGDTIVINGTPYDIDSVYIQDGRKHVRTNYEYPQPLGEYPAYTGRLTFIEGVGTTFGFTWRTASIDWVPRNHSQPYLLCDEKDGTQIFYHNNPDPFFSGCYVYDTITGIPQERSDQHLLFYPNPVSNLLTIESNAAGNPEVFNLAGIRQEIPVLSGDQKFYLDVKSLSPGIYFVKTNGIYEKFIKR